MKQQYPFPEALMEIRILAVGDVCGQPGLDHLEKHLKQ